VTGKGGPKARAAFSETGALTTPYPERTLPEKPKEENVTENSGNILVFEKDLVLTVVRVIMPSSGIDTFREFVSKCIAEGRHIQADFVVKLIMRPKETVEDPITKQPVTVTSFEPIEYSPAFKFGRTWVNPAAYDFVSIPSDDSSIVRGFLNAVAAQSKILTPPQGIARF